MLTYIKLLYTGPDRAWAQWPNIYGLPLHRRFLTPYLESWLQDLWEGSRLETDTLIDTFVRKINRSPRQRVREEDIPHRLREGGAVFGLYYDWTIQAFPYINWINPLEAALPAPLPPSFKSLVSRYIFPSFEVSSIILLANTGQTLYNEMNIAMTRDKILSEQLLTNGFAQFARPNTGDSDPVCFNFNRRNKDGEYPIVRVSHHTMVFNQLVNVVDEIAPSFHDFVDQYLRSEPEKVKV